MPPPTQEQKQLFLQYIREGHDRATAAQLVDEKFTGTQFRRLCSPSSPTFDPSFSDAYLAACRDRGPLSPTRPKLPTRPRTTTDQGWTRSMYLDPSDLDTFIDNVSAGVPADLAARDIGTSLHQINARGQQDPDFADRYQQAKVDGYPVFRDALRAEAHRQAMNGDYKALRDLLLIHVPEYQVLLTSRHEIGGLDGQAIRLLADKHFADLPTELIDALIANIERQEQKQLPQTTDVA